MFFNIKMLKFILAMPILSYDAQNKSFDDLLYKSQRFLKIFISYPNFSFLVILAGVFYIDDYFPRYAPCILLLQVFIFVKSFFLFPILSNIL